MTDRSMAARLREARRRLREARASHDTAVNGGWQLWVRATTAARVEAAASALRQLETEAGE